MRGCAWVPGQFLLACILYFFFYIFFLPSLIQVNQLQRTSLAYQPLCNNWAQLIFQTVYLGKTIVYVYVFPGLFEDCVSVSFLLICLPWLCFGLLWSSCWQPPITYSKGNQKPRIKTWYWRLSYTSSWEGNQIIFIISFKMQCWSTKPNEQQLYHCPNTYGPVCAQSEKEEPRPESFFSTEVIWTLLKLTPGGEHFIPISFTEYICISLAGLIFKRKAYTT